MYSNMVLFKVWPSLFSTKISYIDYTCKDIDRTLNIRYILNMCYITCPLYRCSSYFLCLQFQVILIFQSLHPNWASRGRIHTYFRFLILCISIIPHLCTFVNLIRVVHPFCVILGSSDLIGVPLYDSVVVSKVAQICSGS